MTPLAWRTRPRPAVSQIRRSQLVLEQRQHLLRPGRHCQPVPQLGTGGAAPDLLQRHGPVAQLGRGHRQERREPPRLEVHADRPGRRRVAELQGAGERRHHDAVGVPGRLEVGAGADAERRPEVDDEHRRRHRRQRQPRVRRRALEVVEVVDQPVQRRSRHSGHVLHASQHRRRTGGCRASRRHLSLSTLFDRWRRGRSLPLSAERGGPRDAEWGPRPHEQTGIARRPSVPRPRRAYGPRLARRQPAPLRRGRPARAVQPASSSDSAARSPVVAWRTSPAPCSASIRPALCASNNSATSSA